MRVGRSAHTRRLELENNSKIPFAIGPWLDVEMETLAVIKDRLKAFMDMPGVYDTQRIELCTTAIAMYLAYQKDMHRWLDDKLIFTDYP
jgi:hypothetical protein